MPGGGYVSVLPLNATHVTLKSSTVELPDSVWFFCLVSVDASQNIIYTFSTYINPTTNLLYENFIMTPNFDDAFITPMVDAFVLIGGSHNSPDCNCVMKRIKVFEQLTTSTIDIAKLFAYNFPSNKNGDALIHNLNS